METTVKKPVVLIMDDNKDQRDILKLHFGMLGYEVMTAASVSGAILILHDKENEGKRFVVVVDMHMWSDIAATSSLDFLRHVKRALRHRVFPIVYTGMNDLELERKAIEAGAIVYLHKLGGEERLQLYVEQSETFFQTLKDSTIDYVTDLNHRASFVRLVTGLLDLARTRSDKPLPPEQVSLVLIDLDYFKRINDTHGLGVGDDALRLVADCIRSHIRQQVDIVGRLGGDEFAICFPGADTQRCLDWGEKLSSIIASAVLHDMKGRKVSLALSFGVGTLTLDEIRSGGDLTALLRSAEWHEDTGLKPRRNRARGLVPNE